MTQRAKVINRILIVSADSQASGRLSKFLTNEEFQSEIVSTGEKALEKIWSQPSTFLLLDLELPGISGMDVLKIIRQDPRSQGMPIITLSNEPSQGKILTAFNFDVDDYITKPFHDEELVARIKAVICRRAQVNYQKDDILKKGKIEVQLAYHRVICNGEEIKLTPKEYELLILLIRKENRVLSRQYLLEAVWGLDKGVTTRSVDMLVARLRKKLKREGTRWIETVQGYGYRIPSD